MKFNGKWKVGLALLFTLTSACDPPDDGPKGETDADAAAPATQIESNKQAVLLGKGAKCTGSSQCQSGFCVSGVCCSSACTEGCKTCALPSARGECVFQVSGGLPQNSSFCKIDYRPSCGQDGSCDGKGGCRKYVKGSVCKLGECDDDDVVGRFTCDGLGHCNVPKDLSCYPYSCDSISRECFEKCRSDQDCAGGHKCSNGNCSRRQRGAKCDSDTHCLSGHCADGVCCNVACIGPCISCTSEGTCELDERGTWEPMCEKHSLVDRSVTPFCDVSGECEVVRPDPPVYVYPSSNGQIITADTNGHFTIRFKEIKNSDQHNIYILFYKGFNLLGSVPAHQESYTITTLGPGEHTLRIGEKNAVGETLGSPVRFQVVRAALPPGKAANLSPKKDAKDMSITPTFTWKAATNAKSYYINWGFDEDRMDYEITNNTSFKPAYSLEPNTTYYWRVDALNGDLKTEGTRWKFKTKK